MNQSFIEAHLIRLLERYETQNLPLDRFVNQYFRSHRALGSKDRRFIGETVYGMIRWQSLLDHIVGTAPLKQRLRVFQAFQPLHFLSDPKIPNHIKISFPENLFNLIQKSYGEKKAMEICQISNFQAPLFLRFNPLKTTKKEFLQKLAHLKLRTAEEYPLAFICDGKTNLRQLPEFKEGLFEIQDAASQAVAHLIEAKPKDHVLDYCAGSGGKSLAFAHLLGQTGQLYLHDLRPYILVEAKKRLKRAGIQNAQFLHPEHPQLNKILRKMDWTLVDAPCSGTGTLRRNPDQKWKFSLEILNRLCQQQREIFESALRFVKPKGFIVYATCSILAAENEEQTHFFLKKYPLKLIKTFQSLPTFDGPDGFYAVALQYDTQDHGK